jgi:hypothetical protein
VLVKLWLMHTNFMFKHATWIILQIICDCPKCEQ